MYKIFVVEDDASIKEELITFLENSGYEAEGIKDFKNSEAEILASGADLILMDIEIPYINGEMLLAALRRKTDTPVIMVTSRTSEVDEVLSMSYGADDYITKPYNPTILLLRISAVLKRYKSHSAADENMHYGGFTINKLKGTLSGDKGETALTKNEMIIFEALYERMGEIVSRDMIMTRLWDNEEYINDNALTVNISRLRNKLAELGLTDAIETRKKQGYILKEQ